MISHDLWKEHDLSFLQLGKKSYILKWDIRKMKEEFSEWLTQLGTHSLFFDGAL
jgi:hypothetical protein